MHIDISIAMRSFDEDRNEHLRFDSSGWSSYFRSKRKATTGMGELLKRGSLTPFSHSEPCMGLESSTVPK